MEERTAVLKTNRTIRSLNQRRRGSHYALQNINKEASLAGSPSSRQSSLAILSTTAPATTAAAIPARFACPFLKANPRQTEPTSICARSTWPNITRLKEHLSRRHAERKISCPRCDATFDGELEQQDHLRSEKLCDITTKHPSSDQPSNTISSQQMARLKKRSKGQHRENEEEKWYEVFSILFPQSKRPDSPYADIRDGAWGWDAQIMNDLKEFVTHHAAQSAATSILAQENFQIRGQCSRPSEASPLEKSIKKIISTCVEAAFEEYHILGLDRLASPTSRSSTRKSELTSASTSSMNFADSTTGLQQTKIKDEKDDINSTQMNMASEEEQKYIPTVWFDAAPPHLQFTSPSNCTSLSTHELLPELADQKMSTSTTMVMCTNTSASETLIDFSPPPSLSPMNFSFPGHDSLGNDPCIVESNPLSLQGPSGQYGLYQHSDLPSFEHPASFISSMGGWDATRKEKSQDDSRMLWCDQFLFEEPGQV